MARRGCCGPGCMGVFIGAFLANAFGILFCLDLTPSAIVYLMGPSIWVVSAMGALIGALVGAVISAGGCRAYCRKVIAYPGQFIARLKE